jgi:hypothetical protein
MRAKQKTKVPEERKKKIGKTAYYNPKTRKLYRIKRPGTKKVFVVNGPPFLHPELRNARAEFLTIKYPRQGRGKPKQMFVGESRREIKIVYLDRRKKRGTAADRKK